MMGRVSAIVWGLAWDVGAPGWPVLFQSRSWHLPALCAPVDQHETSLWQREQLSTRGVIVGKFYLMDA